jgi:hypothetical protein
MSEAVRRAFKRLIHRTIPAGTFAGVIVAVDENAKTCDVEPSDGSPIYFDVRLKAMITEAVNDEGLTIIPTVGSDVLVSVISKQENNCYISVFSRIDKYLIKVNGRSIEITLDGVLKLNGDSYEGIIKAGELKTQLDKNTAVLSAIQAAFKAWAPVANDGGAVLKGLSASFINLSRADLTNIENPNVKHG